MRLNTLNILFIHIIRAAVSNRFYKVGSSTALPVFDSEIMPRDIASFLCFLWIKNLGIFRHSSYRYQEQGRSVSLSFGFLKCSVSCGRGSQARYVSCRDAHDGVADELNCAHLPRPAEVSLCFSPCGEWQAGDWSPVSMPTRKQALVI